MATSFTNEKAGSIFFKAQKLEVSHQGVEKISDYIVKELPESMKKIKHNILQDAPTQVLPSLEIFPAKVHGLFHFREMKMDDFII